MILRKVKIKIENSRGAAKLHPRLRKVVHNTIQFRFGTTTTTHNTKFLFLRTAQNMIIFIAEYLPLSKEPAYTEAR